MKRFCCGSMLVLSLVGFVGCGGEPEGTKVTVQSSQIVENLKKNLEEMAKSGKTGSGLTALESDINGIKASDKAKGDALHEGFRKCKSHPSLMKSKPLPKKCLASCRFELIASDKRLRDRKFFCPLFFVGSAIKMPVCFADKVLGIS